MDHDLHYTTCVLLTFQLAQVALLFDELDVVVLAVEPPLMSYVVRGANCATPVGALEATLVVRRPIHRHLHDITVQGYI